jgi:hypothetical protein
MAKMLPSVPASGMRGLPAVGCGDSVDKSGSIACQESSGTNGWLIAADHAMPPVSKYALSSL